MKQKFLDNIYIGRCDDDHDAEKYMYVLGTLNYTNQHISREKNVLNAASIPIHIQDIGAEDIQSWVDNKSWNTIFSNIEFTVNNKRHVLVCCQQGKDRSATLLTMYLMQKYNVTNVEAYQFVKTKRQVVSAHDIPSYKTLLDKFEATISTNPFPHAQGSARAT